MQGLFYSTDHDQDDDDELSEEELYELADALAMAIHKRMGARVFWLQRGDIADLIDRYVCDLQVDDQSTVAWMIWQLFQDARDIATTSRRR
ncbi:MAG: hypothetical protein HC876_08560 [Chloroflexaceae bacterium]|nr:hypothetical protein [Chloroflexaceae bacterium]NJO05554.1 hypothetical protein [Chloroflexaceae bacterium]